MKFMENIFFQKETNGRYTCTEFIENINISQMSSGKYVASLSKKKD